MEISLCPVLFSSQSAPFIIHRISHAMENHSRNATKSTVREERMAQCCVTDKHMVHRSGTLCEMETARSDTNGILCFSASEGAPATEAAIHKNYGEDRLVLPSFIPHKYKVLSGMQFELDNSLPGSYAYPHHALMTSPYMTRAENGDTEVEPPERPDDALLCLAANAAEELALDTTYHENLRHAARFVQYPLSMSRWEDLGNEHHMRGTVATALRRWEKQGFGGFPIATRGCFAAC
jgi:hypothetical protein